MGRFPIASSPKPQNESRVPILILENEISLNSFSLASEDRLPVRARKEFGERSEATSANNEFGE